MRGLLCTHHGLPDQLVLAELPSPVAGPGQVVIAVTAASVNFPDVLIIQNKYQTKPPLPFSPGSELVGTVSAVGAGVTHVALGDRVMAFSTHGAFAELAVLESRRVLRVPPGLDDHTAASFPLTYGTAHHALRDRGALRAGETLLVLGAAGGIGLAAVEIAKAIGATVIAGASSEAKRRLCLAHGADFAIDYTQPDFRAQLQELTGGNGVDVVCDMVGGVYTELAVRSMAWRGRLLVVGFAAGAVPSVPLNLPLLKGCDITGVFYGEFAKREPSRLAAAMEELAEWHAQGLLKPHVAAVFSLDRARVALELVRTRQVAGKVIITIAASAPAGQPNGPAAFQLTGGGR